jgi:hypothetical protein
VDAAQEQAALVAWLAEHDEPCPVCGYNVRALTAPTCPECAAPLRLGVTSPQHLLGPWVLAIIACSLALGFDGVVMTLGATGIVVELFMRGTFSAPYILIGTFVTLGGLSGITLWALIARRRQWRMAQPNVQWARAGAVAVAMFIIHAIGGLLLALVL